MNETTSGPGHEPAPDAVLEAHVRARLAEVTQQAASIRVTADRGHVILRSVAPADEVESIMAAVRSMPGVRQVTHEFEGSPRNRQARRWSAPPTARAGDGGFRAGTLWERRILARLIARGHLLARRLYQSWRLRRW